ncbi:amino acid adenylation domain-containing protein [Salibacterium sp. K-3]
MNLKNISNIYECSPLQKGMLFHTIHQPDAELYVQQLCFRVEGTLDIALFKTAWNNVISKHEALRTTFHWKESDKVLQVVHKELDFPWVVRDWCYSGQPPIEFAKDIRKQGINVTDGPLMNFHLLCEEDSYYVIWTFHHLLMDGWSMPIVLNDVITIYTSLLKGEMPYLEEAPQYHRYISWLNQQDLASARHFFKKTLQEVSEPSYLLHAEYHNAKQDRHADYILDSVFRMKVEELAKERNVTPFSIFQGAWALVINSITDQKDVLFGSVMSGRQPEIQGVDKIVGPFINTLPLRVTLQEDYSLLSIIQAVQSEQSQLSQFDYTPLYEVQKLSEVESSLFDSIVVFENYPFDHKMFNTEELGFWITDFVVEEKSSFPLSLAIIPYEDQFALRFHYDSNIFSETVIEDIKKQMVLCLEAITHDITRTVDSIQLINAPAQLAAVEGDIEAGTLFESFEKQAKRTPQKVAVKNNEVAYTYHELLLKSQKLAQHLLDKGLINEDRVAIYMKKSPESIIALLGILKAGGVYVPLDAKMPKERISYILNDSKARFVVTLGDIPSSHVVPTIRLEDTFSVELRDHQMDFSPEQTAYIMYTSGSTGKPKGVNVTHSAALQHYEAFAKTFNICEEDVVLQFGTLTFDPSLEQVFPTLLRGGCVVVKKDDDMWSAKNFTDNVNRDHITIANLPTPYWNEIVNYYVLADKTLVMDSLRLLAVGGDTLSVRQAEKWYRIYEGNAELCNFYGPTEIVTTCSYYPLKKNDLPGEGTVPIGYPFPGRALYVLDSMGRAVSVGQTGELYIGGSILASGYFNVPERTAESFIPDPFRQMEGARMYKTGDLARILENGTVQFLGRKDDQVKVRGFRVEVGEIEKALLSISMIKEALVVVGGSDQRKRIYAYVTTNEDTKERMIKTKLKEYLPDYMIPNRIVLIEALPLLTNGKIDKQSLPKVNETNKDRSEYRAAVNDRQKKLVEVWEEVLQVQSISTTDNFFELGGDSIIAMQIVARCQEFGLSTNDLFHYQTIEKIDQNITKNKSEIKESRMSFDKDDNDLFTPIQKWFFEKKFPNPFHWNQSIILTCKEIVDTVALDKALESTFKQHDVFTTVFKKEIHGWVHEEVTQPLYHLEIKDIRNEDQNLKTKLINQAQTSLDFKDGPLVKAVLFKEEKGDSLFLTIHHLVVDGVSWRILLEDLGNAYVQFKQNTTINHPAKTTSIKEWAYVLRQYAHSEMLLEEVPFWKEIDETQFVIPKDSKVPHTKNTEGTMEKRSVTFSKTQTDSLITKVHQTLGTKIQETLIAALLLSLREWSQNQNVKIDIEGHGRENIDQGMNLTRTVGWFTTLYPFSYSFKNHMSLLKEVINISRELRAVPNNGLGYGVLKFLKQEPFNGQADVSFNYLGQINTFSSSVFEISQENIEPIRDPSAQRAYLVDLEGAVYDGELVINWMYSKQHHYRETMDQLTSYFTEYVEKIIEISSELEGKTKLPKHFERILLDQEEWDLVNEYPNETEDIYPMTPAQEGMLFHTMMHPESGVYVEQISFEIIGNLDVDAFEKAWQHVISQNDILRASYLWKGFSRPFHVINSNILTQLEIQDWIGIFENEEDLLTGLKEECEKKRKLPFDVESDSLIRLLLIKLDENRYYFVWSYHHLLLDGWSMPMVIQQMTNAYAALKNSRTPVEIASPSFGKYVDWQQNHETKKNKSFFQEILNGYESRGLLVHIQSGDQGNNEIKHKLSRSLTKRLKQTAINERTTLNTLIQTAWGIFLGIETKSEMVVFGSVLSGRTAPLQDIEQMVGMFINTLPVGMHLPQDANMNDLLSDMHRKLVKINEAESTSLLEVKEWIYYKEKALLFDTCLIFANFPNLMSADNGLSLLDGVTVKHVKVEEQTNFPLTLSIVPGEQLELDVNYNCSCFREQTIHRYLNMLENILLMLTEEVEYSFTDLKSEVSARLSAKSEYLSRQKKDRNVHQLNQLRRKSANVNNKNQGGVNSWQNH